MSQHVIVRDYNPDWSVEYEKESAFIKQILKENCIALYHIGSTSVPGLAAKPIIDIMGVVRSLNDVDAAENNFTALGYECLGEFGIEGRRYFRKGGDERTHQIHIFQKDDLDNIIRHLAFKDYLMNHDEVRREYGELKKSLAKRYPYDIEKYCDGKDEFVKNAERAALSLYDSSWDRLYIDAKSHQYERKLSPTAEAGSVSASLMTFDGNIYSGVCIDTACSLGMCAERSAIASMITNGEHNLQKLVVVMPDESLGIPCGACMEMMMQISDKAGEIEILTDYEEKSTIKLNALLPRWWGNSKS